MCIRDSGLAIALTLEGEDGVGATLDFAIRHAGEVNAKEGEVGIGDGIDKVADLVLGVIVEFVVVTTEADDFLTKFDAVFFCEAVKLVISSNSRE